MDMYRNVKIAVTLMNTVNVPLMVRDAMAVEKWETLANAVNKRTRARLRA